MVENPDNAVDEQCKIVLLAGAGASCLLQLPTLDDLVERAAFGNDDVATRIRNTRDSIQSQPFRFRSAVFEELIARLKYYIKISESLHIDKTFQQEIGQLPVDIGTLEWKWKRSLVRCYRILLQEYGPGKINPKTKEFAVTIELLKALAKINCGRIHVYTTNYDCSYQVLAANCNNLAFMTHINSDTGNFTESWHFGNPIARPGAPKIYIHRLHGCLAWFNDYEPQAPNQGSTVREVYGAGSNLQIDDDDYLDRMCIKLIASQLIGTNPAFSSAFDEFSWHLKTCNILLVWGYSFRDLEVVRVINSVFYERQSPLHIFYVDPYKTEDVVRDTIRRTLLQAPIQLATKLRPEWINWTPSDGIIALVPAIVKAVKQ